MTATSKFHYPGIDFYFHSFGRMKDVQVTEIHLLKSETDSIAQHQPEYLTACIARPYGILALQYISLERRAGLGEVVKCSSQSDSILASIDFNWTTILSSSSRSIPSDVRMINPPQ